MSSCFEAEIQMYVDGELDRDRAHVLALHLERCPACDREAAAFTTLKRALRRERVADADAVARLRVFAARLTFACRDGR